jgi:hypothetical protein
LRAAEDDSDRRGALCRRRSWIRPCGAACEGGAVGRQIISWLASLPLLILLAPFWTALHRFIIVRDNARRYLVWDMRVRRVLLVTFVLSLVGMLGGMSLVFGIARCRGSVPGD